MSGLSPDEISVRSSRISLESSWKLLYQGSACYLGLACILGCITMCFFMLAVSLGAKEATEAMGDDIERNIRMASQLEMAMKEAGVSK